jgi:hypothetical protein
VLRSATVLSELSYDNRWCAGVGRAGGDGQAAAKAEEIEIVKNKPSAVRPKSSKRQQINALMEAVAFVIARRQMKQHWGTGHRAVLTSVI